jgi:hypothetical protein
VLGSFLVEFVIGGKDDEPFFGNHVSEGVVHELLKGHRGVGKSEEHYRGFKEALVGDEGGLPLMSVFDSDIIVSPSDIKLSEHLGIPEFVNEVRDEGKGVGVTNHVFVDITVVLAGSESSVRLFDKEEGGSLGGIRGTDLSGCQIFVGERFRCSPFFRGKGIDFPYFGHEGFIEVNFVVIGSRGWQLVVGFFGEH